MTHNLISLQPQSTLPDVLIWMFSNNKRLAYARIPAQNILYSVVEEEKGKDCGKIFTAYFKVKKYTQGIVNDFHLWVLELFLHCLFQF